MYRDVLWSVFEKVSQSNYRFNGLDNLIFEVHSVKMAVGFGGVALNAKGKPVSVMAHLKRNIIEVKSENNCPVQP